MEKSFINFKELKRKSKFDNYQTGMHFRNGPKMIKAVIEQSQPGQISAYIIWKRTKTISNKVTKAENKMESTSLWADAPVLRKVLVCKLCCTFQLSDCM